MQLQQVCQGLRLWKTIPFKSTFCLLDSKWATTPNSCWLHCQGMLLLQRPDEHSFAVWQQHPTGWTVGSRVSFISESKPYWDQWSSPEFSRNDLLSLLCIRLLLEWGLKPRNLLTIKQPKSSLCPWPGHLTKALDMVLITPSPSTAPAFIRPEKQHILFFMYLNVAGWSRLIFLDANVMPVGKEYPKAR